MSKTILFDFEKIGTGKDKASKDAMRYFSRAGASVVQQDVSPLKRASGVTFKDVTLTFADSQKVSLRVKASGDIFEARLNGALIPIKNQDDHPKAIIEIVDRMDTGRVAFQKKLAKISQSLPASVRTAAPKMMELLVKRRDDLKDAIGAMREEAAKVRGA